MKTRGQLRVVALLALSVASFGCVDPSAPSSPREPTTGGVVITVSTVGAELDPDGYYVLVDARRTQAVGINSTATITGLATGPHTVQLDDLAKNCSTVGLNSGYVDIPNSANAVISFSVSCAAPTQIAFVDYSDGAQILVAGSNGTGFARLNPDLGFINHPTWSPDGRIGFASFGDHGIGIYTMSADGTDVVRLSREGSADFQPAWSADGTRIAFVSQRDGNDEIYAMNADGTKPIRLTNNVAEDTNPAWSPDGSKIAFVSMRDGHPMIYVMSSDGSGVVRITWNIAGDDGPAWSPDGTRIAFSRVMMTPQFESAIFVMRPDGSDVVELSQTLSDAENPSWSPDGLSIAFAAATCDLDDCYSQIVVIKPDKTTYAVTEVGKFVEPAWRK